MNAVMERAAASKGRVARSRAESEAERERKRSQTEFIALIDQTKEELKTARDNFNFVTDATLVEYYIYEIKAAETQLDYYLKRAKRERVTNPDLADTVLTVREGERRPSI